MGMDFAAVHDSFWTHAADIPSLNRILRDAFVRMHSEDIVGRLAAEFKARYAGSLYRATVLEASTVGRKIIAWRKAHARTASTTMCRDASFEEVALEAKRQELLKSEDPERRKEGESMVTPTSIWLANQDPKAMTSSRITLLGDTKDSDATLDEVKDKVLGAEFQAFKEETEMLDTTPADIDTNTIAAAENVKLENEDFLQEDQEDLQQEAKKPKLSGRNNIHVWLPLTFPPVPKKGGWDVSRLRESKYFFS